jgi:hypothetical protein
MGQTAADTQREIDGLRLEITDAASELDRRVTQMLDVRARADDLKSWTMRMVEERPKAVGGVGAGIALGVALLAASSVRSRKKKKTAAAKLAAFQESAHGEAARLIETAVAQARGVLAASGSTLTNLAAVEPDKPVVQSEPSMIKKLIWTALTAGSLAIAGIVARKFSTSVWQAIMHEEPPTTST